MTSSSSRLITLFATQAREFKRDFGAIFFSLIFPLFFVIVLVASSLMASSFSFEVALVDEHANASAPRLVQALASDYMTARTLDRLAADAELREGSVQAIIVLPREDLLAATGELELIADQRFQGFARMALEAARARMLDAGNGASRGFRVRTVDAPGPGNSDFVFMYPGMLALALLQLGLFATATPLLRARERGTLRHLLMTPLRVRELLIAQVGFRFVVAMLQIGTLLLAGALVVDLALSQWLGVLAVSLLGAAMLICIGYALAGLAPNLEGGMAIIMIANFTMMFAGNIFASPEGTPALVAAAHLLPVSYLADAFRQVITGASGLWPLWLDVVAMAGWLALALMLALRTFRLDMIERDVRAPASA